VRKWLADALDRAIDWNNLRLALREIKQDLISLPLAEGNPAGAVLQVTADHRDPDGRLRGALLAFARREILGSWTYEGGDEDSARAANLVAELAPRLVAHLEREAEAEVAALRKALTRQALLLGLAARPKGGASLADALFTPAPTVPAAAHDGTPEARITELRHDAARWRPEFQALALSRAGCFQGTGKKVHAVDIVRLVGSTETDAPAPVPAEARDHVKNLSPDRITVRLRPLLGRLVEFRDTMRRELGDAFDKAELLKALPLLAEQLEATGSWPQAIDPKQVKATIAFLRDTRLVDTVRSVDALLTVAEQGDGEDILECLGRVDLRAVDASRTAVRAIADFVTTVERSLTASARDAEAVNPMAMAEKLAAELDATRDDLGALVGAEVAA
jgi:hypothetical protein